MAILTRPANIQKGSATVMTVNRTELAALVTEIYYQDINNWKEIFFQFKHPSTNQKATCLFVQGSDNGEFKVTHSARGGAWQIDLITIKDFDKGHTQIKRSDLSGAQQAATDFNMTSGAAHGDLYIGNGQTVQLAAGSDKVYGDLIIETGGVLEILPGGAITTIDVTENCIINGVIDASNGETSVGTWNKPIYGETLTYTTTQAAGGAGGDGHVITETIISESAVLNNLNRIDLSSSASVQVGDSVSIPGIGYTGSVSLINDADTVTVTPNHGEGLLNSVTTVSRSSNAVGGAAAFGNGGGGGKSHATTPQDGQAATASKGGDGGGGSVGAPVYGMDGADGGVGVSAGAGGSKGAHGQAIFIRAYKVQGGGTVNASGDKGGDGGSGTGGGSGFAGGGAAAGGAGGKIWIRHKTGTPNLTLNVAGGAGGNRGWEDTHITTNAEHGQPGAVGSTDVATY